MSEDKKIHIKDLFEKLLTNDIQKKIIQLIINGKEKEEIVDILLNKGPGNVKK